MTVQMKGRSLLTLKNLTGEEIRFLLDEAKACYENDKAWQSVDLIREYMKDNPKLTSEDKEFIKDAYDITIENNFKKNGYLNKTEISYIDDLIKYNLADWKDYSNHVMYSPENQKEYLEKALSLDKEKTIAYFKEKEADWLYEKLTN